MCEAAHSHRDGMRVPSGDGGANITRQFFHAQGAQHHLGVRTRQRDHAAHPEEIRSNQHISVEYMAVEHFGVHLQFTQQHGLGRIHHPQGVLYRQYRCGRMGHGTNSTNARSEMGGLMIGLPQQHSFEIARRFDNLQIALFQLAILHIDNQIAVAFDAGNMVNINFYVFGEYICHS